jgi:aryl-alcohol dehydrogenase-like predicted oxidoreductase
VAGADGSLAHPVALATGLAALGARRPLGGTGLLVCPVGLGTMQFGWTASDVDAMRVLDAYVAAGGNLIDTANMYGGDQSTESFALNRAHVGVTEDIIGRWLASRRPSRAGLVISTKVRARMWDGPDGAGLRPAHVLRAVDDSLRRLRTDYVDVLYAHWPDPAVPAPDWLGAFGQLVAAGKVRAVGTSNFCGFAGLGDLLSPLLALAGRDGLPRVQVEQPRYSLLSRAEYEPELQAIALREGLGIVAYSSLAGGFLGGVVRPGQAPAGPRAAHLTQYCSPAGWALLAELERIAAARDRPVAAVAVAWLLAQPGVTAALVGPESVAQLAAAAPAATLELTAAELAALTRHSWRGSVPEFVDW